MDPSQPPTRRVRGRPEVTSHARIEEVAFALFARQGFAGTTLDAIAAEVGVGRRTIARYFPSKNDIPWGQFDRTLDRLRGLLAAPPDDVPVHEVVQAAVVEFNRFPDDARPRHVDRMRLILQTPQLQAHSVLRYNDWRQVIADEVARRTGHAPTDLLPQVVGHVSLALSLAAYQEWLAGPAPDSTELLRILDATMEALRDHLRVA